MKAHPLFILFTSVCLSCVQSDNQTVTTFHDAVYGYAETVTIESGSTTTIYISGQIGEGETLEDQMYNVLINLEKQLAKHGAGFEDLVKINTYIVNYQPEHLDVFRRVRKEVFGENITPASTLVGVQSLALPEWKIEIDAVAIRGNGD